MFVVSLAGHQGGVSPADHDPFVTETAPRIVSSVRQLCFCQSLAIPSKDDYPDCSALTRQSPLPTLFEDSMSSGTVLLFSSPNELKLVRARKI